jgi:sucrose synthase
MESLIVVGCGNFECRGLLTDKKKPIIFSMARLDKVKNMSGLLEWYGKNKRLRELANLVLVAGDIDPAKSKDREEVKEIHHMHDLIKKYELHNQFRWIQAQRNIVRTGELYRYIADSGGIFVQVSNTTLKNHFLPKVKLTMDLSDLSR